jgi:hypothetical protein
MSALGQKRTCAVHAAMSALGQKRTLRPLYFLNFSGALGIRDLSAFLAKLIFEASLNPVGNDRCAEGAAICEN